MKEKLGATNALYPLVTAIVGATVDGRPDFATVAHVGIAHLKGITLGMGNIHLTNKGILENKTFSVNLPSEDMVVITDHIGMVSGTQEDKSKLFDLFYGELDTAPMIEQCKVTMEVKLIDHVKLPTHDLFVGEVVGTYAEIGGADQRHRGHRQAQAAAVRHGEQEVLVARRAGRQVLERGQGVLARGLNGRRGAAWAGGSAAPPIRHHRCAAKAVVTIAVTSAFEGTLPLITSLPSMASAGVAMTP